MITGEYARVVLCDAHVYRRAREHRHKHTHTNTPARPRSPVFPPGLESPLALTPAAGHELSILLLVVWHGLLIGVRRRADDVSRGLEGWCVGPVSTGAGSSLSAASAAMFVCTTDDKVGRRDDGKRVQGPSRVSLRCKGWPAAEKGQVSGRRGRKAD